MAIPRSFYETPVHSPPVLENIYNVENFWHYIDWQDDRSLLTDEVSGKFERTLKDLTGFTDDNPPEKPTSKKIECGKIIYNLISSKGTKKPKYGEIFHEFGDFVKGLQSSIDAKTLRKGYRTVEVEGKKLVYISLEMLLNRLQSDVATMISEKEGVNHTIILVEPAELIGKTPDILTIVSGTDYGALTEYNATMCEEAKNLKEKGDTNTGFSQKAEAKKRFKKLLLNDSFYRLGGKPDLKVDVPYPFGDINFIHSITPKARPSYESMINAFLKPVPKQLKKGGKVGDFMMATALSPEGIAKKLKERELWDEAIIEPLMKEGLVNGLKEKGIWDDKFQKAYDPRIIEGEIYVLLSGPEKRLEYFKDKYSPVSYDQHVSVKRKR